MENVDIIHSEVDTELTAFDILDSEIVAFEEYYHKNYHFFYSAAELFKTLINSLLKANSITIDSLTFRIKDKQECISKFKRKYYEDAKDVSYKIKDYISDLIGLRVVCLYSDEISNIQKCIEENFKEIEITDKIKDMESTENQFGYKGLHLDLMLSEIRTSLQEYGFYKEVQFELQIRTIIQDAWSVLDHKIKYKKNIPNQLKRRVNCLSALFEIADEEFLRIRKETQVEQEKAKETIEKYQSALGIENLENNYIQNKIDVFIFLSVVKDYFPQYHFIEYKVDGFVEDLLKIDKDFSAQTLISALTEYFPFVERFSKTTTVYMNPYTTIRNCIYLFDKTKYQNILFPRQLKSLETWILENGN